MGFNYNYYYYVNDIDEARNFQMQPNQVALLMDNYKPLLYVKSSNQLGQATIKTFKLEEVVESTDQENKRLDNLEQKLNEIMSMLGAKKDESNN